MLALSATTAPISALPPPTRMTVESLITPVLGLSETKPRFAWVVDMPSDTDSRGLAQQSARVTVVRADDNVLVWDSGQFDSLSSYEIAYAGTPLTANTAYAWTAEWWANTGDHSAQSVSHFETGPLADTDWHGAQWLSESAGRRCQFRRTFALPAVDILRARLHVASPGCHQVEINGRVPMPNRMGICAWREPTKTILWQTHDVTSLVRADASNAIGVLAGHVIQGHPAQAKMKSFVRALLLVDLRNGTTVTIPTTTSNATADSRNSWLARTSYVTRDGPYSGSTMDWSQYEPGWSEPDFVPGAQWAPAVSSYIPPQTVRMRSESLPPSADLGVVKPISVHKNADGSFFYTFPINFVGVVRVAPLPQAPTGATITLVHGETKVNQPLPSPPSPPPPPLPPAAGRFIAAKNLGLWWQKGNLRHHVTQQVECGYNLFKPVPAPNVWWWGTYLTDDQMNAIPASPVDFNCTMCNHTCMAARAPGNGFAPGNTFGNHDEHILRHNQTTALQPLFTWRGFQYVLITATGFDFPGTLDAIEGVHIHTNLSQRGVLVFAGDGVANSTSEHDAALLNAITSMTLASQKSNVAQGHPTDCPTRERKGWTGDALDSSEEALYNFDMNPVYHNFMSQIADDQDAQGEVPIYAPDDGQCVGPGCYDPPGSTTIKDCSDIGWTSAFPLITELVYNYTGDKRLMQRHYAALKKYIENLITQARTRPDSLADCDRWGDWLPASTCNVRDLTHCPVMPLIAAFSYVRSLQSMQRIAATVLGNMSSDCTRYAALATAARADFHKRYYDPDLKVYGTNQSWSSFQTLNVPPLVLGSTPAPLIPGLISAFENDLANRTNFHVGVGAVTSKYLLNVLSDNGLHEHALKVATQDSAPSWGYWKALGATTCWETWGTGDSHNHIFLCGGVSEWMWKHVVGINAISPAFGHILVRPRVDCHLGPASAKATLLTPHGELRVQWRRMKASGQIHLNVSVPLGAQCIVHVPKPCFHGTRSTSPPRITESNRVVPAHEQVRETGDAVEVHVESGAYVFVSDVLM